MHHRSLAPQLHAYLNGNNIKNDIDRHHPYPYMHCSHLIWRIITAGTDSSFLNRTCNFRACLGPPLTKTSIAGPYHPHHLFHTCSLGTLDAL